MLIRGHFPHTLVPLILTQNKCLEYFWQTLCCFSTFRTKSILALLHHENINTKKNASNLELTHNENRYIETQGTII